MNPALITAILAALGATMAILAIYSVVSDLFLKDRSRVSQRVDFEFMKQQREQVKKSPLFRNLNQIAQEAMVSEEPKPSIKKRFEMMIEQSGMNITPSKLLTTMLLVGGSFGTLVFFVRGDMIQGAVGGLIAGLIPMIVVNQKRNARLEKLRSQLPDAFDLMARVIRAGQTMSQALQAVADEFPMPIAAEFAYCYEQQNLGLSPEMTYRDLTRRTGLIELKIFVLALLIQQQTGGNLAELLGKLSAVVRDRFRIRGHIRTLTAEGRLQGHILTILPIAMFFVMWFLNPGYAGELLKHQELLVATACFMCLGSLWIRKIVNFDF